MIRFKHPTSAAIPAPPHLQPLEPALTRTPVDPLADLSASHEYVSQAAPALHFFVRYTLVEYVSFMWQHARHLIRRRRIAAPASWIILLNSTWGSAFNFVLQRRARHTYEFTIDQHGIVRSGAGGVTLIKWGDVRAMRSYTRGRLLVLQRGTLPIPARCLSPAQADGLAAYAALINAIGPM